jgi:diguanylate cyclase (GGDEF)-like protein/PAS domain S-box-containing protein
MLEFLHLVVSQPDDSVLYAGNYDPVLVTLSVAIAVFASFAALLVSEQVAAAGRLSAKRWWTLAGGLCLGTGIWAMHFVGMLAFSLPCSTSYDPLLTLLSTIPGILASVLAIHIISRHDVLTHVRLVTGGLLIGAGIGAMHYSGMAALRLNGLIRYDIKLFLLSIVVAVLLAMLALWIRLGAKSCGTSRCTWLSALVMGLAVSGMHYTAMTAAYFIRAGDPSANTQGISPSFLAAIVLSVTSLMVVVTIVATLVRKLNLSKFWRFYRLVGLLIAGWGTMAWFGADYYYDRLAGNLYQRESQLAMQQAEIIVGSIDESIALLKGVPRMLAREEEVRRALRRFDSLSPSLPYATLKRQWTQDPPLGKLNASLEVAASSFEADVIWIMTASGNCIASSNADKPDSFVGVNYADRDYFRHARAGQPGHQYAVGRTSNIPGLYYSYPVSEAGRFIGAVVVKRNITRFSHWTQKVDAFMVDANGVIVMASDKTVEFHSLPEAPVYEMTAEKILKQYKMAAIPPMEIAPWRQAKFPAAMKMHGSDIPIVLFSRNISEDVLSIHISRPLDELLRYAAERNWLFLLLFAAGSMLIVAASAVMLYLRESQKAEANLRIAATAFDSQEGMLITDANNVILRVNRAFNEITGYASEEVVGNNPRILRSGRHDNDFYAAMWECVKATGHWKGEIWNRRKSGEIYPELLTITAVKGTDGIIINYVGALTDITKSKKAEEEIRKLAFFDPLTSLPNRRLLLDRLQQALVSSARSNHHGALLFIDLDNFKALNDTMGHDVGDLLLQQAAERLKSCVRDGDTVARLGGDEFVVVLEDLSASMPDAAAQSESIGNKVLAALNHTYLLGSHECRSTPSIGATLFVGRQSEVEELMKQADIAMYQAKKAGRNTLRFFDPVMQSMVTAHVALETDLRRAVIETEQLQLFYQAQVDSSGRLIGVEALLRWQHPERGMISPAEFIPLAEESGLILPLGHWVLSTACGQLAAWAQQPETAHLSIAVNISAKQFGLPTFVEEVLAQIDYFGIDSTRLKLEITEGMLLNNIEEIIVKMNRLKAKGIVFSMDDFGTGYSSMQYLKRLPLDQLKIDQSFVRDIADDGSDRAIVKTIIAMAHSLDLDVIAEGVETEAQRNILMKKGCTRFQGYLFGKPMPIEQFVPWQGANMKGNKQGEGHDEDNAG